MGNTAIVSCTSSDLTPQQAQELSVRLVPLTVSFGDETYEAVTELTNEDFYRKLTAPGAPFPRTAAPNPARFQAAFQEAFDAGAEGVVCITISAEMSATYAAAVQAAGEFEPGLVDVIDSRIVTQAQGLIVKHAADLAATGAEQAEVVDLVHDLVGRVRLMFTPESLEYLQRGGRIGRASALLGSVLSIKPILGVDLTERLLDDRFGALDAVGPCLLGGEPAGGTGIGPEAAVSETQDTDAAPAEADRPGTERLCHEVVAGTTGTTGTLRSDRVRLHTRFEPVHRTRGLDDRLVLVGLVTDPNLLRSLGAGTGERSFSAADLLSEIGQG